MTASVSCSSSAAFHICPESRIIGGIDASMMMSLGTCRLVMPRSESTIASAGPSWRRGGDRALDRGALGVGERAHAGEHVGEAVVGVHADAVEGVAVLREHVSEVRLHRVAEDDRVGDLHHRGLEVDREQHALRLRGRHLLGEERVEVACAHEGGVDDLTGKDGDRLLQHGDSAVARDELDLEVVGGGEGDRLLVGAEVVVTHRGHARLRIARPRAHLVRVRAGVVLDRRRGAAVGVALAQHRVDRGALDLVVAGLDVQLLGSGRLVGVVGQRVALAPELLDGGLELRDRRRDVGELDDVGLGALDQRAQLGEVVADPLLGGEALGEGGQHPAREGDVTQLDLDAGDAGEGVHDRQQRPRGQRRGLVGVRVDDRVAVIGLESLDMASDRRRQRAATTMTTTTR